MSRLRITELPFNAFVGIQSAAGTSELLRLPADTRYLNHVGTVHASAQLALAEASSGEFLLRHLSSADGIVPVVRRLHAKFRQPASGAVVSTASVAPEALDQLTADIARKGRAPVTISVELHDESRAHTLSAEVEWFIQRASSNAPNT